MEGNIIGRILFYVGIVVMVVGVILAYSMANVTNYGGPAGNRETTIQWPIFFHTAIRAVIAGLLLIGFSEIIKLLHSINSKTGLVKGTTTNTGATDHDKDEEQPTEWKLSKTDEEKIYEAYADKAILEIIPSSFEGYCIVKLQEYDGPLDPVIKVVDIGGLSVQEVAGAVTRKKILDWYKEQY
ncbi:hypothetical protein KFZ58_05425 [Virgibacillus sp. NKC19-16]|uniref:hypothetical protein n=1 Tax=Virgibacillus salidurans TaxID=2831673 RepID=UPI001F328052|nr:hypothetical protein [Virgibacillus sp. NKC19-16]UJL47334.1 hypothetical protein KFZ58_05425 [Virgibacillus sp. NKC19-16]